MDQMDISSSPLRALWGKHWWTLPLLWDRTIYTNCAFRIYRKWLLIAVGRHFIVRSRSVFVLNINTIEKQHVKMHIEIDRTTKMLNQGNCLGVGRRFCMTRFFTYMRGDSAIDNAQCFTHDRRSTGEQKSKLIWDSQHPLAHRLLRQNLVYQ
jgi:hypothetical protein